MKENRINEQTAIEILDRYFKRKGKNISIEQLKQGYAPAPERVYISLNNMCQCRCVMCANGRKKQDAQCMSLQMLEKVIQQLAVYDTFFVFYRQEPLLFPKIKACLDIVNTYGVKCQITTNGLLLNDFSEKILQSNVEKVWVSLDGPAKIHDSVRNYKGCYDIVIQNLENIAKKRNTSSCLKTLGISTSCHGYNYYFLPEFARGISHLDIDACVINQLRFCTPEMSRQDAEFQSRPSLEGDVQLFQVDSVKYMEIQAEVKQILGDKVIFNPEFHSELDVTKYFDEHGTSFAELPCLSSWLSCDLTIDGSLLFCNILNKFNPSQSLEEASFMDVWNAKELREQRLQILKHTPRISCNRCSHMLSMPNLLYESWL